MFYLLLMIFLIMLGLLTEPDRSRTLRDRHLSAVR